MQFNCKIILKHKKISFLICKKNKLKFYEFFGWIFVKRNLFVIPDHKSNHHRMIYNYKRKKLNDKIAAEVSENLEVIMEAKKLNVETN